MGIHIDRGSFEASSYMNHYLSAEFGYTLFPDQIGESLDHRILVSLGGKVSR